MKRFAALCVVALTANVAMAAVAVPHVEDFDADAANWRSVDGLTDLTWNATGGPDGGSYASGTDNFDLFDAQVLRPVNRGLDLANASGGAFVGDWLSGGVDSFRVNVRHDGPFDMSYFVRFESSVFGAAAITRQFLIAPNTWTEIDIPIAAGNPQFISFGGQPFSTVFENVVGVEILAQVGLLAGSNRDVNFDVDKISLVPEPSAAWLLGLMLLAGYQRRV